MNIFFHTVMKFVLPTIMCLPIIFMTGGIIISVIIDTVKEFKNEITEGE